MKINYVRLKFRTIDDDGCRILWAKKLYNKGKFLCYNKVNKDGGIPYKREMIFCLPEDIIYEKTAKMNKHYGELEIIS